MARIVREFDGELDEPTITEFTGTLDEEPGTLDPLYRTANRIFGRGSVMDNADGTAGKRDPMADAIAETIFREQAGKMAPSLSRSNTRMVEGPAGIAEVAARRGVGGLIEALGGAARGAGDTLDIDALTRGGTDLAESGTRFARRAQLRQGHVSGFGPESVAHELPEAAANAGASILQTAPSLLANVALPGSGLPLLFAQTGAQEYGQGREAGLNPAGAALRAIPQAAAEIVGEKVGGFDLLTKGIRDAITDNGVEQLGRALIKSGIRELPGEELTTTAQFLTDKAPGIGINQEATLADYTKAVKDTALATLLQSGAMTGAGMTLERAGRMIDAGRQAAPPPPAERQQGTGRDVSELSDAIAKTANIPSGNIVQAPDDIELDTPGTGEATGAEVEGADIEEARASKGNGNLELVESPAPDASLPLPTTPPAKTSETFETDQSIPDNPQPGEAAPEPDNPQPDPEKPRRAFEAPLNISANAMQVDAPTEGLRPGDVIGIDGKPFATKAKAAKAKKEAGRGWAIKRANGGFVVRHQPQTDAQKAALQDRIKNQANIDTERDSMFAAIAKLGGISFEEVKSDWGLSDDLRGLRGAGIKRVATTSGHSIDAMGEMLAEQGYLSVDEHGKYDRHEFEDLFGGELAGHSHYTPEGFERIAAQMQEEHDAGQDFDDGLSEQDIADSGFDGLPEDAKDAVERFLSDYEETEDELEARLEREAIAAEAAEYEASLGSGGRLESAAERNQTEPESEEAGDGNAGEAVARAPEEPREDEGETSAGIDPERNDNSINRAEKPPSPRESQPLPENDARESAQSDERSAANALPPDEPDNAPDTANEPLTLSGSDNAPDSAPRARIEDFGEVLKGARKDYAAAYKDAMGESEDVDIAAAPLSKSWPEPDYQKLLDDGVDPWTVAFVRAARDEIPVKPKIGYKQARWVEQVKQLRDMSYRLLNGSVAKETLQTALTKPEFSRLREHMLGRVELYETVGHEKSLKGLSLTSHAYSFYRGQKYQPSKVFWVVEKQAKATAFGNWPRELAVAETREEALEAFKRMYGTLDAGAKPTTKEIEFVIYSKRGRDGFFIGKKTGKNYIDLKFFDTANEARMYLKDHHAELVALLEKKKEIPNERRDRNLPRIGADHRGGTNVTPEVFSETFGFRGVQFGNYVEGARRQEDLNNAYDGLMDMAGMLGIPPKSISLNGQLGLAFGARGKGGKGAAAAHYEGGEVVINLTKNQGAGSLAHEWWHALDNYFSRSRGQKGDYMTEALDVSLASRGGDYLKREGGVRPEMIAAYGDVLKAINATALVERSKNLDSRRSKDYWSTKLEMTARAFESYIINRLKDQGQSNDYLANIVSEEEYSIEDGYPYPTAAEIPAIRAAYDRFFNTIESKETESGVALFSAQSTASEGETAEAVRAAIAGDTYNHEVDVYATVEDAPDYVQRQAKKQGITVEGFFDRRTGRVAIIASNVTAKRAVEVARHELIGHYGLEHMVGQDEMQRLTARVIKAEAEGNKAIIDVARHVDRTQPGLSPERRAKEIIAVMAERNLQNSIVKRVMDAIRKFLKSIGFAKGDITDAEIAALLRDTQAYLRKEGRAMVAGEAAEAAFSPVYHGTPHVWPPEPGFPHGRPRLDKMGTGEGAAAYGWGWYSAENEAVADYYRKTVGQRRIDTTEVLARHFPDRSFDREEKAAIFDAATTDDSIATAGRRLGYRKASLRELDEARLTEALKEIREGQKGSLYELDIPDSVAPYLLDWDKPLSEQPEMHSRLDDAVRTTGDIRLIGWMERMPLDVTGGEIYEELAMLGGEQETSHLLLKAGIVGTRYLDAVSRGDGKGTYNYVIWDQPTLDKVALLRRNGEKLDAIREAEFSAGLFDQEPTALETGRPLTRAEVLAKQEKDERIAKEAAKPVKETGKQLRGDQVDLFNPQSSLFSGKKASPQEAREIHATNAEVNRQLDRWAKGQLHHEDILQLGQPSEILRLFDMPDLPIHLRQSVLTKGRKKHELSVADLKDIALNVQTPIAVFKSKQGEGHIVLATEARHAKGNIVVALQLDVSRKKIEVNDILSIYPRQDAQVPIWFNEGLLLGYEKRKGRSWLEDSGAYNSRRPQDQAALDDAIVYGTDHIRNSPETLFSGKEPAKQDNIEVDGDVYPATNSNGQRIHPTDEGIRNFWRWFNGFRYGRLEGKDAERADDRGSNGADNGAAGQGTSDNRGRPRIFYHGTADEIRAFDLNHQNRKDKGWLGRGVYVTSSTHLAETYASLKGGYRDQVVMPLYAAVRNPYVATIEMKQRLRWATQSEIDETTDKLKRLGHDGVILTYEDGSIELVAFDPAAVKSAIGNRGTFDPDDADVAFSGKPIPPDPQQKLELQVDPITGKDFFRFERDTAARKRYVAGRKIYDAIARKAVDVLDKVKLADNAPEQFKAMMRAYRVDQAKAQANAENVAKIGMEKLTAAERKMLSDVIEGNVAAGDMPPETVLRIATEIQAALKQQGQDLVELGMLTEDRLIQQYLPRAYRNPLLARFTSKAMFLSWYQKARLRITGARLKSRGLVHQIRPEEWDKYKRLNWKLSSMSDGSEIPADLREAIMKRKEIPPHYPNGLKFLVWRDFTRDEREQMGEIHDGLLRYALGYVETQRDIAIGRLFKAIATDQTLSSNINPGGWAKVPDEEIIGADGVKRYGALSGRYVPEMVRDMIERSTQAKGPLMQVYDRALNFWKEGKTVWNPVAHGNNVVSNIFTIHFAGVNPANPRHWRNTLQQYRKKGSYYQEAVNYGLFGTEWASKDIQDMFLPELVGELSIENVSASRFNKVINFLKKTGKPVSVYRDAMQRAYEFEDQFFKLMLFIDRRQAGASIEDAITDTERYVFNYADIPEGVETLKRTYSPFISYTYKALPMLLHTALTRPDRLLAPIVLLGGANWLAYAMIGGDEEEERKNMPEYLKGRTAIGTPKSIRMPFNVEDRPAYMDMTRRVPLGDLFDMNNQTGGLAAPAPMMPSHPLFTATAALFFNKDTFTGKDLTKASDTDWEAAQKRADWIFKQIVPNAPFIPGSWNFDKLMSGTANAFDTEMAGYTGYTKSGDATPLGMALLDVAGGTKIRSFDPARNKDFKEYELDKERKELMSNIRSAQRNKSMAPGKRESYIDRQREKMQELTRKRLELD